ncbi:alpha/beta fold hydrolase [Ornithinimicrobium pratense]|uniref:Proline iminopeptidase n=2 Tax=Ornithinimicrobium pratense TaxID=2593973 RepID=A0A5J6V7Q5_9MICO|nr:alpha/beta fold hydrolase [Ornithinimicrobium pratense]
MLTLRDGAQIYWETTGNPAGTPLLWLHGGPGTGLLSGGYKRAPDPKSWLIVGLDQRACGRSRPLANEPGFDLSTLQTPALIADLEELRQHLGIERWLVAGGSWGTTLAMAYGQAHPERVTGFVLTAVTDGSRGYVEWISESVERVFPEAWEAYEAASGRAPGQRLLDAYVERLTDPNPRVRDAAAMAWCTWEDAHMSIPHRVAPDLASRDPQFREVYALQVAYSWANNAFLGEQGILDNIHRICHLPAVLIHGRLDISGPVGTARRLHRQWPGSQLVIVEHEGHGGPDMGAALRQAYTDLLPIVCAS